MALVFLYPLLVLMLQLLPISTAVQVYGNITLGSSLTASKHKYGPSWKSPSGEFAFGFQKIGRHGFLLAIWFDKIPQKTVVWSANRDQLVPEGSKVELTRDGQLILRDQKGRQQWSAELSGTGVAHASMLDTGNFVLASHDSTNLWESFDNPTDTVLPTQTINQGSKLVASISATNYSSGRFMFTLQTDGNAAMYTTDYPLGTPNFAYWSTQTSVNGGSQLHFNQSGYMYLELDNGSIAEEIISNLVSGIYYQRVILDYDGVLKQSIYPKYFASTVRRWSTLSNLPSNICTAIEEQIGSGACGFNSFCSLEHDQRKKCHCPPGYSFLDPDDVMKGCKQDFVPHSCDKASEEMDLFEFREMRYTDWPKSDYEHFGGVSEDYCKRACLSDCFCSVIVYNNEECWKKKLPLVNGRNDPSIGGKTMIKVRKANSSISRCSDPKKKQIILSALLGTSIFLDLLLLLAAFIFFCHFNRMKPEKVQPQKFMPTVNLQNFTYNELEEITEGFKEELGYGAFGTVYKGVSGSENNKFVAVKELDNAASEGEREFKAEVSAIGRTNHKNLVQLLGFCDEGRHRLLVFEYVSNGSLANFLFGKSRPSWHERMQIAIGTARGLFYLHEECTNQIIHCDIKPQNILLDDSFTARISDFGLAKILNADQTRTITAIRGTKGYVAPEWLKNMPITVKVDVYSFGILLLELICCRKNFEPNVEKENEMILADWACECYQAETLQLLVENDEEALHDMNRLKKYVMIAIWCIQEDPLSRPTMKKVTQMLEGVVEVSTPLDFS
ncbi:hypothetical protein ACOSP7_017355 [Xanthoceras sorbifolium]